jgi:hypothetical protein
MENRAGCSRTPKESNIYNWYQCMMFPTLKGSNIKTMHGVPNRCYETTSNNQPDHEKFLFLKQNTLGLTYSTLSGLFLHLS